MDDKSLFDGQHENQCAASHRQEPSSPLSGWPPAGRFLVIGKIKLCSACVREASKKLEVLGLKDVEFR